MSPTAPLPPPLEFHFSRLARIQFAFNRDLLQRPANQLPVPDAQAIQELAARMNRILGKQGRGAKPGHLFALVLIQHILHVVVDLYRRQKEPDVFRRAEDWLAQQHSAQRVREIVRMFSAYYAPLPVITTQRTLDGFFAEYHGDVPGRHLMLEQVLLVFMANINPAAATVRPVYDDRELPERDDYLKLVWSLERFFAELPAFGPLGQSLFELLAAPAKAAPDSLLAQLQYIRRTWADLLGDTLVRALLTAEDLVREDEKMPWQPPAFGQTPDAEYLKALASKALFARGRDEPERFSPDTDWMPKVVLLAKSVYVWLDQLAKRYGRPIRRLDEIPDDELQRLADWGFSGLWLIGLWERSEASRKIKNLRGNSDAVASAYSLYDYRISGDLGGQEALDNLKARAAARGIRLASDMVPNHMGVDSRWVREHPDWFLQLDYPPYGAYQFNGPDLSGDPNLDIRVEDGYWNQTDAAVTFRHVDKRSGRTRHIYHGNDGTSMPWNDTAQLDYLRPDVREAVIQLILHVARSFPIMRFDAAMTLTKLHYQRLWFPEPGSGGAIPSRALFGMSKDEFDRLMPVEFWREVVDRVAAEAPDTLLLAEAFWLLEGYFVRTLGMHRVYNSAFMNMLKLEENAKYRSVIKNVLEFDPRVLQRFVNFMNNPDEDTAVAQFGKGDKYFGVCMLLATTPGLPMFGHGQIEGFTEKYGHEFQRAYYDEQPDEDLIRRHEREIFPLLRQRLLFSGAEHFLLFDLYRDDGAVDENVIAHSNGSGDARALVVFHNRWAETAGWIHTSSAYSVPDGAGRKLIRKTLAEGLGLHHGADVFYILRDRIAGLEYLRRGDDLCGRGLFVSLKAYQYQIFTEFREIHDDGEQRWTQLCDVLNGRGVPSVEREFKRLHLAPLIEAFSQVCTPETLRELFDTADSPTVSPRHRNGKAAKDDPADRFVQKLRPFLVQAARFGGGASRVDQALDDVRTAVRAVLALPHPLASAAFGRTDDGLAARDHWIRCIPDRRSSALGFWRAVGGWLLVWGTGRLLEQGDGQLAAQRLDDWLLTERLNDVFVKLGADEQEAWRDTAWVRILLAQQNIARSFEAPQRFAHLIQLLDDATARALIGVNEHGGVLWFHLESFEELLRRLYVITIVSTIMDAALTKTRRGHLLTRAWQSFRHVEELCVIAEYKLERLRALLGYAAPLPKPKPEVRKTASRKPRAPRKK